METGLVFDLSRAGDCAIQIIGAVFSYMGVPILRHYGGEFCSWDGRCWSEMEERTVKSMVWRILRDAAEWGDNGSISISSKLDTRSVNEIVEAMKMETHLPVHTISPPNWLLPNQQNIMNPNHIVPCQNGLLYQLTLTETHIWDFPDG